MTYREAREQAEEATEEAKDAASLQRAAAAAHQAAYLLARDEDDRRYHLAMMTAHQLEAERCDPKTPKR